MSVAWEIALMEPNVLYYRRRISEELAAAERAITDAARLRHLQLIDAYVTHLENIGARLPLSKNDLARLKVDSSALS